MNLAGSLAAFALPDVLTLLSTTGKSGRLRLAGTGRSAGAIGLVGGRITSATVDESRSALLRRLSAYGDDQFWAGARALPDENRLAAELVDGGWLDPAQLETLVRETTVDALVELLRWTEGQFEFLPSAEGEAPDQRLVDLEVQAVLDEAARRDAARPKLGLHAPEPDDVLALPLAVADDIHLDREEWALLALVDGIRTSLEIAELTGREPDLVRTALGELVTRGLLVACAPGGNPVAGLRQRMLEVQTFEARTAPAQPDPAPEQVPTTPATVPATAAAPAPMTPEPVAAAAPSEPERHTELVPLRVAQDDEFQPTAELAELAVPLDRDAVMRLIVGVQGL